ncbi:MAG: uncharacterized protein JWO03_2082 [Bacteroidetes bacterium]|nr:uncharacterized protein [Bacteroidota bacterium]
MKKSGWVAGLVLGVVAILVAWPAQVSAAYFIHAASVDSLARATDSLRIADSLDNARYLASRVVENYLVKSVMPGTCINVSGNAVVLALPDSAQIEDMKHRKGEENFYMMADDANWYFTQARAFANGQGVRVVESPERYIRFGTNSSALLFDKHAKASPGWLVILFRPDGMPKIINAVDIQTEYPKYFADKDK